MGDTDLQRRLEKLGAQLVTDIEQWEKRTRGDRQRVMEEFTRTVGTKISGAMKHVEAQQQKHGARQAKREAKAQRRLQRERLRKPSVVAGVFSLLAAFLCVVFSVLRPDLWWMVFIALGLIVSGGKQIGAAVRLGKEADEGQHEVDALCDELLADLQASPEAVRHFISDPAKTVKTMRSTLKALDQRRQQLLEEDAQGKLREVNEQRAELVTKRDNAGDPQARQRLGDAIEGLDGQVAALRQLVSVTERVDGEYTALLVRLQELKTRVSVARSSGTQVQLDGLRVSVQRLNEELGAIGEAMAAVQAGDVRPIDEGVSENGRRERLERVRE
jgi:hypothetical protein